MPLLLRPILVLVSTVNSTSRFDAKLNQFPGPVFNRQPIDIRCEMLPKFQPQNICYCILQWASLIPFTSPEPVSKTSRFKIQFRWPRNLPSPPPPPPPPPKKKLCLVAVYRGMTLSRCKKSYVEGCTSKKRAGVFVSRGVENGRRYKEYKDERHVVVLYYCGGFILFCNVWVCVCVWGGVCNFCVCVDFVMCGCFGNMYTVLWLRFFLTWLTFFLPWRRFFRDFSSVVRQMPG